MKELIELPTLELPPPGIITQICRRCLTLLSYAVTHFGDGNNAEPALVRHSALDSFAQSCLICRKSSLAFRQHRDSQLSPKYHEVHERHWMSSWRIGCLDGSTELPRNKLDIGFTVQCTLADYDGALKKIYGTAFELHPAVTAAIDSALGDLPVSSPECSIEQSNEVSVITRPNATVAREWLTSCINSHVACRQLYASTASWYPDRLITYSRTHGSFRLVQKDLDDVFTNRQQTILPAEADVPYIALSHCWGSNSSTKPVVLSTKNITTWSDRIPVESLAKTHIEALQMMVELEFSFIWIDSLCIMQDSHEDWLSQGAQMSEVYKYATLVIAALSAASDNDGMQHTDRKTSLDLGFRMSLSQLLDREQGETMANPPRENILLRGQIRLVWDLDLHVDFPLHTRAWVYQEQALARRTLGVSSLCLSWACDEARESQLMQDDVLDSSTLRKFLSDGGDEQEKEISRTIEYWAYVASEYSTCRLTVETDRLLAISAVAKDIAGDGHTLGRYMAGLWMVRLFEQLDWVTYEPAGARARADSQYVAPSWSWASVASPVSLNYLPGSLGAYNASTLRDEVLLHLGLILHAETETETAFEFGRVKSGSLQIKARLHGITRVRDPTPPRSVQMLVEDASTGLEMVFYNDTGEFDTVELNTSARLRWTPHSITFHVGESIYGRCLILRQADVPLRDHMCVYERVGMGMWQISIGKGSPEPWTRVHDQLLQLYTGITSNGIEDAVAQLQQFKMSHEGFVQFVLI